MAKVQFQVNGLDSNTPSIFNDDVTFDGNVEANSISIDGTSITEVIQDTIGNSLSADLSYNDSTGGIAVNYVTVGNTLLNGVSGQSYGLIGTSTYLDVKDTNGYNKEIELDIAAVESKLVTDGFAKLAGPTFTGTATANNLIVDGDFTVNGTNFSASATSITIEDNMVQLAHQNPANTVDLGIVVGYNDGTAKHAGLVKDATDSTWKLFKGVTTEPTTTVDFTQGSLDDLQVNAITATSATIGNVSNTEIQYLEGVTSAIQTQIDNIELTPGPAGPTGATGPAGPATVPENAQSTNYTIQSSDNGKFINATGGTITISTDTAFTSGQNVVVVNNSGSTRNITASGVSLITAVTGATGGGVLSSYGIATILCIGTNSYIMSGAGLT